MTVPSYSLFSVIVGGLSVLWNVAKFAPPLPDFEPSCAESIHELSKALTTSLPKSDHCSPVTVQHTVSVGPFLPSEFSLVCPSPHIMLSRDMAIVAWVLALIGWFLVILCLILRRRSPITIQSSQFVQQSLPSTGPVTSGMRARALSGPRSPARLDSVLR